MLLSNTSVVSVEDGILTLRFARDGDLKGFAASGHDAVLKRVLADGFGLNVMVKGVVGGDTGAPSGATGPGQAAGYGQAAGHGQGAGYGQAAGPGQAAGHGQPTDTDKRPDPGRRQVRDRRPEPDERPRGRAPAVGRPGRPNRWRGQPKRRSGRCRIFPRRTGPPMTMSPPSEPDEEMPQNGTPAGRSPSVPAELTGVDLIQRELGGQVIGEIDG